MGRINLHSVPWLVIDSVRQVFRCERCGQEYPLGLPMRVTAWCYLGRAYQEEHRYCKPKQEVTP